MPCNSCAYAPACVTSDSYVDSDRNILAVPKKQILPSARWQAALQCLMTEVADRA